MYRYNPYIFTAPEQPLTMEAFIAPADFDQNAQELNIVQAFAAYTDVNKKYIFSVGTSTITVLPAVTGRIYAYAENGGAYTTIASGAVTWMVGSTKRHVIVIDSTSTINAVVPIGGVWAYLSEKCYSVNSYDNQSLKYIHCQKLSSLTSFVDASFRYCSSLSGILHISQQLTSISSFVFSGCISIYSISFSNGLLSIARDAFSSCSGLINISLPNSITSIGNNAFSRCTELKSITLPNSITSIGNTCFSYCTKLSSFNFPNKIEMIQMGLLLNCTIVQEIIIPNSVTSILDYAFQDCIGLLTVSIPSSVVSMVDATFYRCTNLAIINCYRSTPPTLGTSYGAVVFYGVNKTACVLHVPVGSLAAYQAAAQWNAFTNIIEDL